MKGKFFRFARNIFNSSTAFPAALKFFSIFLSYLFASFVSNFFGFQEYGKYVLANTALTLVSAISTLGLDTVILRKVAALEDGSNIRALSRLILKSIGLILLNSIVFGIFMSLNRSAISALIFNSNELDQLVMLIAIGVLPYSLSKFIAEIFRGLGKFALHSILAQYSYLILPFIFYFLFGYSDIVELLIISAYSNCVLSVFLLMVHLLKVSKNEITVEQSFRGFLKEGLSLISGNISSQIRGWTVTILLNYFAGATALGQFNVFIKISKLIVLPLTALNVGVARNISSLFSRGDLKLLFEYIKTWTKRGFLLSSLLFLVIILFSFRILPAFAFEFNSFNVLVLIILSFGNLVDSFFGPTGMFLQMTNHYRQFRNLSFISWLISLTLGLFLIPSLGLIGAVISNLSVTIFWNIYSTVVIRNNYGKLLFIVGD